MSLRPVHYDMIPGLLRFTSIWHYWKLYLCVYCLSGMSLVTNNDDDEDDDDDEDNNNNNNTFRFL